jgi:hypothetical protein
MQNLFSMGSRADKGPIDDDADYMQVLFGTPRGDGTTTPRGGPAFTPRGTLAALSHARGNKAAVMQLGMPIRKQPGAQEEDPDEGDALHDVINMGFAKDWVSRVFETPRAGLRLNNTTDASESNEEVEKQMADAVAWLEDNFGMTPRGGASVTTPNTATTATPRTFSAFTPRGINASKEDLAADNAVMRAAMQAALSTPRSAAGGRAVDDTPMVGAVNKMFKGLDSGVQHV